MTLRSFPDPGLPPAPLAAAPVAPLIGGRDCAEGPEATLERKEKVEEVGIETPLELALAAGARAVVVREATLLLDEAVPVVALDPRMGGRANPPRVGMGFEGAGFGGSGGASLDLLEGLGASTEEISVLLFRFVEARSSSSSVVRSFLFSSISTFFATFVCRGVKTGRGSRLAPAGVGRVIVGSSLT